MKVAKTSDGLQICTCRWGNLITATLALNLWLLAVGKAVAVLPKQLVSEKVHAYKLDANKGTVRLGKIISTPMEFFS